MNGADDDKGGDLCHEHNLPAGFAPQSRAYGIRVSLPRGEPLRRVLGEDWHTEHWYATEDERERALEDMLAEHAYSRFGDRPRIVCERIGRDTAPGAPAERPGAAVQAARRKKRWWRR